MGELVLLDHVGWVRGKSLPPAPGEDLVEPAELAWPPTNAIPFGRRQVGMIREWYVRHSGPLRPDYRVLAVSPSLAEVSVEQLVTGEEYPVFGRWDRESWSHNSSGESLQSDRRSDVLAEEREPGNTGSRAGVLPFERWERAVSVGAVPAEETGWVEGGG